MASSKAEITLSAQDRTRAAFDSVGRRFAALSKHADGVSRRMQSFGSVIAGLAGGAAIAGIFTKFITETQNAQLEQAQLAAVLHATGEAAGFTRDQLNKMAAAMARDSTFSEGDINRAQTRLLSYTGVVGEQFPAAMQAAIDMAARMGTSIESAAEAVGRALDVPSQGLSSLSKQGFRFTEEQKKVVEALEKSGRVAEAQQIVLEALNSSYGGAAKAARETFGGAVVALRNELDNLMTGSDGSLDGARQGVEALVQTLRSQETKEAFAILTELLANTLNVSARAVTGVANFGRTVEAYTTEIEDLQRNLERLQGMRGRGYTVLGFWGSEEDREREIAAIESQLREAQENFAKLTAPTGPNPQQPSSSVGAGPALNPEEIARLAGQEEARKRAAEAYQRTVQEAQRYLENLKSQLRATEELTVEETVLRDIQEGRVKAVGGVTQQQLLAMAREIDARRVSKELLEQENKAREDAQRLRQQQIESVTQEADSLASQNQSLRDQIEEIGRTALEIAELRAKRLEHAAAIEEEKAAMLRNAGASGVEIQAIERKAALLRDQAGLTREEGKKNAQELDNFAKNAAQNIQGYLGETFANAMEGNFEDIGDSFVKMVNRMVAEALAADLTRALFGQAGGGTGQGFVGTAMTFVRDLFGGGRAVGGAVGAGMLHPVVELGEPEVLKMGSQQYLIAPQSGVVEPLERATAGKAINLVQNFHISGPSDRRTQAQIASEAFAGAQRAFSRNG